jgi:hypothetical protein
MEVSQFVIIVVVLTLAILFVILGIQVFYILKEFRKTIQKINKIIDDGGKVSGAVGDGVVNMSGFVNGLKTGLSAIATLRGKGE